MNAIAFAEVEVDEQAFDHVEAITKGEVQQPSKALPEPQQESWLEETLYSSTSGTSSTTVSTNTTSTFAGVSSSVSSSTSSFSARPPDWLPVAILRLKQLESLGDGWNRYDSESPNADSCRNTQLILQILADRGLQPTRVDPSAEGGICISFFEEDRYADIECFNTGEILAAIRFHSNVDVWELKSVRAVLNAMARIRSFIRR